MNSRKCLQKHFSSISTHGKVAALFQCTSSMPTKSGPGPCYQCHRLMQWKLFQRAVGKVSLEDYVG